MALFTKKVQFSAFQFDPREMASIGEYDLEDFVAAALGDVSINCVTLKDDMLFVSIYTFSEENIKETFALEPYEWLVEDNIFKVMTDEEFKEFGTKV